MRKGAGQQEMRGIYNFLLEIWNRKGKQKVKSSSEGVVAGYFFMKMSHLLSFYFNYCLPFVFLNII